jgi:hypothetical protein
MNQPNSIKTLVEDGIYEMYQEKQPALVAAIKEAVESGESPAKIEARMKHISPTIAQHCYHIASVLKRKENAQ